MEIFSPMVISTGIYTQTENRNESTKEIDYNEIFAAFFNKIFQNFESEQNLNKFKIFSSNGSSIFPFLLEIDSSSYDFEKNKPSYGESEVMFEFEGDIPPEKEYALDVIVESWEKEQLDESDFNDFEKMLR